MVLLMISSIILGVSFRKGISQRIIYPAMLIMITRNFIPILDFENLKPIYSVKGDWEPRVVLATCNITALGIITALNFGNIKGNFVFVSSLLFAYTMCCILRNDKIKSDEKLGAILFYGAQVFTGYCFIYHILRRLVNEFLKIINSNIVA